MEPCHHTNKLERKGQISLHVDSIYLFAVSGALALPYPFHLSQVSRANSIKDFADPLQLGLASCTYDIEWLGPLLLMVGFESSDETFVRSY